jgi:hypothetical protein
VAAPGLVKVSDEILAADDREEAVRSVISRALRRHRAYELLVDQLERNEGEVNIARFAEVLPEAFPAVQGKAATWNTYASAFVNWFSYARLLTKVGDRVRAGVPQSTVKLLGGARFRTRSRQTFPMSPPGPRHPCRMCTRRAGARARECTAVHDSEGSRRSVVSRGGPS